jgi:hypothetical protein
LSGAERGGRQGPDFTKIWDARIEGLSAHLGAPADIVNHAVTPFFLGGVADTLEFPSFVPGMTYVTCVLTGEDAPQVTNSHGNYELMICTREGNARASELISRLARYTCEALVDVGDTMEIGEVFGDATIRGLVFVPPIEPALRFEIEGKPCGALLCLGITSDELEFAREQRSQELYSRLRASKIFPYTIPGRPSVLTPRRSSR